ncbi:hypothetical protein [Streptomyces sp. NBRC 110028]|uniref:hypothetical protein n=1 Tax=Streptomyces sp. NBRC 110028 TaxID=1621260 RepID=UPI0006E2831D|nr:hypothetical protein [Streptomyces sp. NBRC 110028]
MTPRQARHRFAATTLAAVAFLTPLTTGCDAVDKALDCGRLAVEISNDVDNLQDALSGATADASDADKVLDALDKDIDKVGDHTDNADVGKALGDLRKAVDNVQTSVDSGEHPDLSPVKDAAAELTDVCTP